jgi:hypothetical protein
MHLEHIEIEKVLHMILTRASWEAVLRIRSLTQEKSAPPPDEKLHSLRGAQATKQSQLIMQSFHFNLFHQNAGK